MGFYKIGINELINELVKIREVYGDLPVYTFNQNDCTVVYDYILSGTMEISIRDIVQIDDKVYIKDRDYDEWLSDKVDGNEDYFIEIISKRHPELSDIAVKILKDGFIDEDWDDDWDAINCILEHYYLNDLEWEKVVLITNYN